MMPSQLLHDDTLPSETFFNILWTNHGLLIYLIDTSICLLKLPNCENESKIVDIQIRPIFFKKSISEAFVIGHGVSAPSASCYLWTNSQGMK